MPDITLTIDGQRITVPAGTNIVDAARMADVAIPVFCYHPKMKPVGMCRMCLVEIWAPKMDPATRQPVLDESGKAVLAAMNVAHQMLPPACTTLVSEGMEVRTQTEKVKFAQKGMLEFLLTSHPLDCPVCDKGGECPLQNLTMGWGPGISRYDYADKIHFEKPLPLGDLIYLDRERCILCARCVRFEDELAGDPVLGFDNRGRKWEIISMSEPGFDSKYSGNTTDICPVGALTSADFRFKARVWELRSVPSIDPHTSEGANISLDMRYDEVARVMPRENDFVNEIWIADKTRFAHRFSASETRLTTPLIRRGSKLEPCSWEEAIRTVAEKLQAIKKSAGGAALAGLAGDHCANEDLFLFGKLFRETLGSNNLDQRVGSPADLPLDTLGQRLGVGKGTNLLTLGKETAALVLGADPEEEAPVYLLRLRAMQQRGAELIVANGRSTKLDDAATAKLRYRYGEEATLVQALCAVLAEEQLINAAVPARTKGLEELLRSFVAAGKGAIAAAAERAGVAEESLRKAARALAQAKNTLVIYGHEAQACGAALQQALANLVLLLGAYGRPNSGLLPILPHNNSRGALDMGIRPDLGPGYTALAQPGLGAREVWAAAMEGRVRGMYLMGIDPVANYPDSRQALEALEFLVVQELFLTPTAELADVVLPAASFIEREGTFTNAERRVQRFRQARRPLGETRPDWMIVRDVARAIAALQPVEAPVAVAAPAATSSRKGARQQPQALVVAPAPVRQWLYSTSSDVATELSAQVPGYAPASYAQLSASGSTGHWGRQANDAIYYDGTSYTNSEGVGVQLAAQGDDQRSSFTLAANPSAERVSTDERYPLLLVGAAAHYNGGTLMRDSLLLKLLVQPTLFISPQDAKAQGISSGDSVQLSSAAGALTLTARIDFNLQPGAVVAFDNLAAAPLAPLQTGPRTPVAVTKA